MTNVNIKYKQRWTNVSKCEKGTTTNVRKFENKGTKSEKCKQIWENLSKWEQTITNLNECGMKESEQTWIYKCKKTKKTEKLWTNVNKY